jgi:hypothetical protein
MPHAGLGFSAETHRTALAAGASVFPRYSARVAKETLLVIILVLITAALVMLATLVPADLFGATKTSAACSTLDLWSLASPWCSTTI